MICTLHAFGPGQRRATDFEKTKLPAVASGDVPSTTKARRRTSRRDQCDPSYSGAQAARARASVCQVHNDSTLVKLLDVLLNLREKRLVLLLSPHLPDGVKLGDMRCRLIVCVHLLPLSFQAFDQRVLLRVSQLAHVAAAFSLFLFLLQLADVFILFRNVLLDLVQISRNAAVISFVQVIFDLLSDLLRGRQNILHSVRCDEILAADEIHDWLLVSA